MTNDTGTDHDATTAAADVTAGAAVAVLAEDVWQETLRRVPYFASRAGQPVEAMPHATLEEAEERASFARGVLQRLDGIETTALGDHDRDTAAYLRHAMTEQVGAADAWWWSCDVTPYRIRAVSLDATLILGTMALDHADDVDRYVTLCDDLVAAVETMPTKLRAQAQRGWHVPGPALARVTGAVHGQRGAVPDLLRVADDRTAGLSDADRGRLRDGVEALLRDRLLPAFDAVLDHLSGPAREAAPPDVGIGQFPGGEEAYQELVNRYATYSIDAREVHDIGLADVADLTERMAAVRRTAGFGGDEAAWAATLRADARFNADSPEGVATTYRRHVAAIEPLIDQYFSVLPEAPYDVRRLEPELEPGLTYGHYELPKPDEPRGLYRFNGSGLDTRSQLNAAAIIFHELIPGHHFHLARQAENASLPKIRSEVAPMVLGAYTEGWAEYAASLGFEMGLYDDPWDHYGALIHQRFIAQRLVVDTGMNLLGWSRDRAREFMAANTMESADQVASETLRYSVDMPAQALGYRLGFRRFTQLRAEAAAALGAAFDVRAYHEVVLGPGSLPLAIVADNVARWTTR